jgi:hypothetical protein
MAMAWFWWCSDRLQSTANQNLQSEIKALSVELESARKVCEAVEKFRQQGAEFTYIAPIAEALEEWRRTKAGESNE